MTVSRESADEAAELLQVRPVEIQAHAPVMWVVDKQAVGLAIARRLDDLKDEVAHYKSAVLKLNGNFDLATLVESERVR